MELTTGGKRGSFATNMAQGDGDARKRWAWQWRWRKVSAKGEEAGVDMEVLEGDGRKSALYMRC
jgi:hypothetical protein